MKKIIHFIIYSQILSGLITLHAETLGVPEDIKKSTKPLSLSLESHPLSHKASFGHPEERIDTDFFPLQADNAILSNGFELFSLTGRANDDGLDPEEIIIEFIKPIESEPSNLLGGSSGSTYSIFSFFTPAQLQSAAAIKLLDNYQYHEMNTKDLVKRYVNTLIMTKNSRYKVP